MVKNYIFLAKNKIVGNKKYFILNISMMIIMLSALLTTITLSVFIYKFTDSNYNYNYSFKKLFVTYNSEVYTEEIAKEIISDLPNIEFVSSQDDFFASVEAELYDSGYYNIYLVSCTPNTAPLTLNGNKISENSIIIPDNFKPEGYSTNLNGRDFIGKQIKIRYNIMDYTPLIIGDNIDYGGKIIRTKEKNLNVIGTYDNEEYFEANNSCYILNNDMNMLISENIKYTGYEVFSPLVVICNDYKNVESVISNLRENSMFATKASFINTIVTDLVVTFGYVVAVIFMLISVTTTFSSIKINLQKNKTEYALLKCMGYKNTQLFAIMLTEQMIISSISLFTSYFISTLVINKLNMYIVSSFTKMGNCEIKMGLISFITGALISLILPILILLLNSIKLRRISPIEANK